MKTLLSLLFSLLIVAVCVLCLVSVIQTGHPFAWIDNLDCLLHVGDAGVCLSGMLFMSVSCKYWDVEFHVKNHAELRKLFDANLAHLPELVIINNGSGEVYYHYEHVTELTHAS